VCGGQLRKGEENHHPVTAGKWRRLWRRRFAGVMKKMERPNTNAFYFFYAVF
jgi:hypothetical protein